MVKLSFQKERSIARIIAYVVLLVVIVVFACLSAASTAYEKPVVRGPSEFAGKIVTVYLNGSEAYMGHVLRDVELKEIGEREILVGIGADTKRKGDWMAGVQVGVAWDMVMTYTVMTPEEFEKKVKEQGNQAARSGVQSLRSNS